jgi:hypothetical protein
MRNVRVPKLYEQVLGLILTVPSALFPVVLVVEEPVDEGGGVEEGLERCVHVTGVAEIEEPSTDRKLVPPPAQDPLLGKRTWRVGGDKDPPSALQALPDSSLSLQQTESRFRSSSHSPDSSLYLPKAESRSRSSSHSLYSSHSTPDQQIRSF